MFKRFSETHRRAEYEHTPDVSVRAGPNYLKARFGIYDFWSGPGAIAPSPLAAEKKAAAVAEPAGSPDFVSGHIQPLIDEYRRLSRQRAPHTILVDRAAIPLTFVEASLHSYFTNADAAFAHPGAIRPTSSLVPGAASGAAPVAPRPHGRGNVVAGPDPSVLGFLTQASSPAPSSETAAPSPPPASGGTLGESSLPERPEPVPLRPRILIACSGGLSSLATLWWALQNDYYVYLCYVNGIEGGDTETDVRCLLQLLRFGRDQDGRPFVDDPENPAGEAVYRPFGRVKILQMPSQPYRW